MSETENLLKIQEFIDDHKDDLSEGQYLNMVNSLMRAWKIQEKNNGPTCRGYNAIQAVELMDIWEESYYTERDNHYETRKRYSTLSKTNTSLLKQIELQKEQINRLKKTQNKQSEIEIIENMGVNRCKYTFSRGQFKGELCGVCCKNGDRCNSHKNN